MQKQPAEINYFFKDGYKEFGKTFAATFRRCGSVIADSWEAVCDYFGDLWENAINVITFNGAFVSFFKAIGYAFMFGLSLGRLIISAILTPVICFTLSVIQAVALFLVMGVFYLLYSVVAFADWLYRCIKRISTSCPNCQEKYALPTYVCQCGAKHTQLVPSRYGVFKRTCQCGRKLKTTFFNGRHRQPGSWVCPKCGYELGSPLQVDIPIPVVGGPSSGKTCFVNMAIAQLEKHSEERYGLEFEYKPNDALGDDYEANKRNMQNGQLPLKTDDTRLKYYQFYLAPKGVKVRNLISLCDVAGEAYDSNDEIGKQVGYKYANAFLMIVDPLSVREYREEIADTVDLSSYKASIRDMDEVLNTLIVTLENMNCLNAKTMIKTDVAVVFAKGDIPGLEEKIGPSAVRRYMQQHNIRSKYDAANGVCEEFLRGYAEDNFLNSLKSKFRSVQFFTSSALGHVQNGEGFTGEGVEEPVLWLIDKVSPSIDLRSLWGKKN